MTESLEVPVTVSTDAVALRDFFSTALNFVNLIFRLYSRILLAVRYERNRTAAVIPLTKEGNPDFKNRFTINKCGIINNKTYFLHLNDKTVTFSLLQNGSCTNKLLKSHFFSALTLGLKKDDMGFMPVLSALARVFWAAVIFLGGWNKGNEKIIINMITLCRVNREIVSKR